MVEAEERDMTQCNMVLGWIAAVSGMLAFLLWAAREITHGQAAAEPEEDEQEEV